MISGATSARRKELTPDPRLEFALTDELPALAAIMAGYEKLLSDSELRGLEDPRLRLMEILSRSKVWIIREFDEPVGCVYITPIHLALAELHGAYFGRDTLESVGAAVTEALLISKYERILAVVPEYAPRTLKFLTSLGFEEVDRTVTRWKDRTWPVHQMLWERKDGTNSGDHRGSRNRTE